MKWFYRVLFIIIILFLVINAIFYNLLTYVRLTVLFSNFEIRVLYLIIIAFIFGFVLGWLPEKLKNFSLKTKLNVLQDHLNNDHSNEIIDEK